VADFLQPLAISEGQIQNGRLLLSLSLPHNTSPVPISTKYSLLSLRSAKNLLQIAKNTKLLFATKRRPFDFIRRTLTNCNHRFSLKHQFVANRKKLQTAICNKASLLILIGQVNVIL
jgi:hypothetical protein